MEEPGDYPGWLKDIQLEVSDNTFTCVPHHQGWLVSNWNLKIISTAQSPQDETPRYAAYSDCWLKRVQLELTDNTFPVFYTNEVGSLGLSWLADDRQLKVLDNILPVFHTTEVSGLGLL